MASPSIRRKRILFLTPQLPYPPEQGTAIRNYALLAGVAQHHDVSLLSFSSPTPAVAHQLAALCSVVRTVPVEPRSLADRLRSLVRTTEPDIAGRLWSPQFASALKELLGTLQFDVVQVEGLEMAGYGRLVRQLLGREGPAIVFDAHNAEYVLQWRACATDLLRPRRWPAALYSYIQWQRLVRYERQVCRDADAVLAVSDADAAALRRLLPGLTPVVVPNGVDLGRYRPGLGDTLSLRHPAIVFTGKMDYRPNIDAAIWLCRKVLPLVWRRLPSAAAYLVGKDPPARVTALGDEPRVIVTGYVADILPYFGGADVYAVPLRVGGGTRLKVLEAMAAGVPLVSTTVGVEGISLEDGRHALLADSPKAYAEALLSVLQNAERRKGLTAAAQELVVQQYDWNRILPSLLRVYDAL